MKSVLTDLLNLDSVTVTSSWHEDDYITLEIKSKNQRSTCPRCGEESNRVHQNHWHIARDLRLSDKDVYIKYNRRQFKCKNCKKPFSEDLDFIGERRQYTTRFAEAVVMQLINSNALSVAKNNNLTTDIVQSMLEYVSQRKWNFNPNQVKRLGIDEIALRKGQKNYVVVLVDLDKNELIGMAEFRTHKSIKKELERLGDGLLTQIEEVSIDLSGNYRGLVKRYMPNANIVADRFHVMKIINETLNKAKNSEKKAIDKIKNKQESQRLHEVISGSKYALIKLEDDLTEKQKIKLEEIRANFPTLAKIHQQKEDFRNIFETASDWTDGVFKLIDWIKGADDIFQDNTATILRWFEEITNYFETRTTSGVVEGINNRLKLIKRLGYGFTNIENFRLRCLACWQISFV